MQLGGGVTSRGGGSSTTTTIRLTVALGLKSKAFVEENAFLFLHTKCTPIAIRFSTWSTPTITTTESFLQKQPDWAESLKHWLTIENWEFTSFSSVFTLPKTPIFVCGVENRTSSLENQFCFTALDNAGRHGCDLLCVHNVHENDSKLTKTIVSCHETWQIANICVSQPARASL